MAENTVLRMPENETETVFLIEAVNSFELGMMRDWIAGQSKYGSETPRFVVIRGRKKNQPLRDLVQEVGADGNPWLQPLRVIWSHKEHLAEGSSFFQSWLASLSDRPGPVRRRFLSRSTRDQIQIAEGQGAFLQDVRHRFDETWGAEGVQAARFPEFIKRQALIALDRAERSIRGARYKVARLLADDVMSSPSFQRDLGGIAGSEGKSLTEVERESIAYLKEMSASQTPLSLDVMLGLQRRACRSAHHPEIDFVPGELDAFKEWTNEAPVVLLVTHKSMLDTMAVSCLLYDHNIPVPLTFGGINLATFGLGKLASSSGVIFLRRAFQDNPIYKATFKRYVDYLIEKRFSLMWALEGTRSRTGKLLPPRYGLMNYAVESLLRTRTHGLRFVPVSVSYDQITEVDDYVIEQRGEDKKPEGASWMVRFLVGKGSKDKIYVRFGQPVLATDIVAAERLNDDLPDEEKRRLVEQIAMRAAVRLNDATPITLTSLVTMILLSNGPRARTLEGLSLTVAAWMELVERRRIPVVGGETLCTPEDVEATLLSLERSGVITRHDSGLGAVYRIAPGQYHKAAYYRNTVIHFFVTDALIELALLQAAEQVDSELAFWREILALRDLLKFEFYFATREDFLKEVREKLAERDPNWQGMLQEGAASARELIEKSHPLVAQGVLRSFIDAYQVVADALDQKGGAEVTDKTEFLTLCMTYGNQAHLLQRIFSEESLSKTLYEAAYKLADHRDLLTSSDDKLASERAAFAEQVRSVNRRLDILLGLAVSRQTD